jgi:hypothetical protein
MRETVFPLILLLVVVYTKSAQRLNQLRPTIGGVILLSLVSSYHLWEVLAFAIPQNLFDLVLMESGYSN